MSGIPLQSGIIYGPILSRRLGRSLGINLLPIDRKICTFDCIYCQYGPAYVDEAAHSRELFPAVDDVLISVERALKKPRTMDYLTFSGNGEPTIHPDFPEIVQGIISLRDKFRSDVKVAILSNSSRVIDPKVVSSLQLLDSAMMKLDAGDEQTFHAINQPMRSVNLWDIVEGLLKIPNLTIQSLLLDGEISNIHGEPYEAWARLLAQLRPREIHIYSVERPTADERVMPVAPPTLQRIADDLTERFGLLVKAFW